jgi:hypothetical protein
MSDNKRGQGRDDLFITLKKVVADLAEFKAKYEDHRHSVAGIAGTGTAPSTGAGAAAATASTISLTASSD